MVANLIGYWVLGLPISLALCFGLGMEVRGLWIGLCVGLVAVGTTLLAVWTRKVGYGAPRPAA